MTKLHPILLVLPATALALAGCTVPTPKPSPAPSATQSHPATPRKAAGTVLDGAYLVGKDIKAGTYTTPGPKSSDIMDSCYWERDRNSSGELSAVIANDNITGPGRVTVRKGEIFKVTGQCVWSPAR